MKRILVSCISFILVLSMTFSACATDYSSQISSVMSSFALNNYSCKSASQQQVNGTYRTVEMLEIIAKELDSGGRYSSQISSVMSNYALNNYSCKSAVQQAVNGTYRTVEMLEIIAKCLN